MDHARQARAHKKLAISHRPESFYAAHKRRECLHWAAFCLDNAIAFRNDGCINIARGEFAVAKSHARQAQTFR